MKIFNSKLSAFSKSPFFWGVILFLIFFISYTITLSNNYTSFSLDFARQIEMNDWQAIFVPHRILANFFGWIFYQVWLILGWRGKALFPSEVFNGLSGAINAVLLYFVMVKLTKSIPTSVITSLGFAFSCGIWIFSTEAEFVMPPMVIVFIILLLFVSTSIEKRFTIKFILVLSFISALSVIVYITNVFIIPAIVCAYFLLPARQLKEKFRPIFFYCFFCAIFIGAVYFGYLYFYSGITSLDALAHWNIYGGQGIGVGVLYGKFQPSNILFAVYAFLRSIIGFPNLGLEDSTNVFITSANGPQITSFIGFYILVAIAVVALLIGFIKNLKKLINPYGDILGFISCWAFFSMIFSIYWVPKDMQFSVPILISFWILVGIMVIQGRIGKTYQISIRNHQVPINFSYVIGFFILLLISVNYWGIIQPHHLISNNKSYEMAIKVKENTAKGDLIITLIDNSYFTYFSDCQTISILDAMLTPGLTKQKAMERIDQEVIDHSKTGSHVFILPLKIDDQRSWDTLIAAGFSPEDMSHFKTKVAWVDGDQQVLEVIP